MSSDSRRSSSRLAKKQKRVASPTPAPPPPTMLPRLSGEELSELFDKRHSEYLKANKDNPNPPPTHEDYMFYMRGKGAGLYSDTSELDYSRDPEAKNLAFTLSPFVVGLSSPGLAYRPLKCSGLILKHGDYTKILTSTYILGDPSKTPKIDILLPNREKARGSVSYVDYHHNMVLIYADCDLVGIETGSFDTNFLELGDKVMALGRHYSFKLMGSTGKVKPREDHLESDDLLSSSCTVSEWGIGGPLVRCSSGSLVGMNFFSKEHNSPFMPISLVMKCVEHLLSYGEVVRPWLGIRMRSLEEVAISDLELHFLKFRSAIGVIVKEVVKKSPADEGGLEVGDVIQSCNGFPISSPVQFAEIMFKMVEDPCGKLLSTREMEKKAGNVWLNVQRRSSGENLLKNLHVKSFVPLGVNRWPVLPPARPDICSYF